MSVTRENRFCEKIVLSPAVKLPERLLLDASAAEYFGASFNMLF